MNGLQRSGAESNSMELAELKQTDKKGLEPGDKGSRYDSA